MPAHWSAQDATYNMREVFRDLVSDVTSGAMSAWLSERIDKSVPSPHNPGFGMGFHAVLTYDCEDAARFMFETSPLYGPSGTVRPMREHDFRLDTRGSDERGRDGEWHKCGGCGKRVFFLDGYSEFQRRLTVAAAWIDDVSGFSEAELKKRSVPRPGRPGVDIGFHGVLSMDCERAEGLAIEEVLAS